MKKYLIFALFLAFITTGAFATDVGVGLLFGIGSRTDSIVGRTDSNDQEYTESDFGLTGFFGWKYFDFTLGFSFMTAFNGYSDNYAVFHFGGDLKIPITFSNNKIRIFPMIGADTAMFLASEDGYNFLSLVGGVHGGVGADFILFKNMFIRGNVLYTYNHFSGVLLRVCAGWRF